MSARSSIALVTVFLLSTMAVAQDSNSRPKRTNNDQQHTVVVDVWAAAEAKQADSVVLSRGFAQSGLQAAMEMKDLQHKLAFIIQHGYPLEEYWIMRDRDRADDALKVAELTASTDADRAALAQLTKQNDNLREWTDWLVDAHRHLQLAEYYTSPSALEDDEMFQKMAVCSRFLVTMMASGRLAEDNSCRY